MMLILEFHVEILILNKHFVLKITVSNSSNIGRSALPDMFAQCPIVSVCVSDNSRHFVSAHFTANMLHLQLSTICLSVLKVAQFSYIVTFDGSDCGVEFLLKIQLLDTYIYMLDLLHTVGKYTFYCSIYSGKDINDHPVLMYEHAPKCVYIRCVHT